MTRQEMIDAAVRCWLHYFDMRRGNRDAGAVGPFEAIARQSLFVELVRDEFKYLCAE